MFASRQRSTDNISNVLANLEINLLDSVLPLYRLSIPKWCISLPSACRSNVLWVIFVPVGARDLRSFYGPCRLTEELPSRNTSVDP